MILGHPLLCALDTWTTDDFWNTQSSVTPWTFAHAVSSCGKCTNTRAPLPAVWLSQLLIRVSAQTLPLSGKLPWPLNWIWCPLVQSL